jgi:hypothetical protein
MAALTDLSDLINRQTRGNSGAPEAVFFHKVPRIAGVLATTPVAGRGVSFWQYDGMPGGGPAPGTAAIPDRTTPGAIPFTAPGGSREKLTISAGIIPLIAGVYQLYDRLFHIGNLSGISTTDQTIQGSTPTPALTRNTGGAGNFAFYEIYTAVGTTGTTLTMTYTNQDGVTGKTSTINFGGTGFREATRFQRIPLAAGDSGLRAIEKIRLTTSTGTAGSFAIGIAQPISWIPVGAPGVMGWRDFTTGLPGVPAIDPNACLSLWGALATATPPELFGSLAFVEK